MRKTELYKTTLDKLANAVAKKAAKHVAEFFNVTNQSVWGWVRNNTIPQKTSTVKKFCFKSTILFLTLIFSSLIFSQELHHETISSIGKNAELDSGIYVTQTIGQHSIASYSINNLNVQQGYQQSFWNYLINSNEYNSIVGDITFYPNPIIDFVNFNFLDLKSSGLNVLVFDYAGRVLITTKIDIENYKTKLDLSSLPSGSYLIHLNTNKFDYHTKIIKK